ncbi:MAG: iron ABC transporter permease [Hyphomonas sp.]|nr:iron ABC transporter permease [Hyphomonas sp.]
MIPPALIIGLVGLPVLVAVYTGLTAGGGETWDHILNNRLVPYTLTTLIVLAVSAVMMLGLAVPAAWLTSLYEFPGRRFFSWALILPLAMPGYVMAYAWADLMGVAGPLQASIREMTGWSARDYWFPNLFSAPGLAFVLASALFPYVYITARAAFTMQSLATLEAARSLGTPPLGLFWKVGLPVALPTILAGVSLALMEAAADYGAADFLGVQTLGVGIVRSWMSFGQADTAARLALMLIFIASAFLISARVFQGQRGSQQTSKRWLTPRRTPLPAIWGAAASLLCASILLLCFAAPVLRLIWLVVETRAATQDLWPLLRTTLLLGAMGTLGAFTAALVFTLATKRSGALRFGARMVAAAGYAAPGVVLGLGALYILKVSGQALSGSIAIGFLLWIYVSRFTSAGVEPLQSTIDRLPKSLDDATRSLGVRGVRQLFRVDLPLLAPGAIAAGLILFVEILKELPATLMLRPFGWDTLAVQAHAYATDERLPQATLPSLLIVLAGLIPVILLSWRLSRTERT